jgi:hypothetical protein
MPKQLTRGQAAKTVTLHVPPDQMHCRQLNQVMLNTRDEARLRGKRQDNIVELRVVPHRDSLIRRLFSRDDIASERVVVRAALAQAAFNVTPERLRRLGSPGRLAVLTLQLASGANFDRDVKVAQVRSATELLAGNRKKRSFLASPVKTRSAWMARSGASTLAQADSARRVQLRRFCTDSAASASLPALLAAAGDKPASIAGCISIFRAAALSFIVEDMKGAKLSRQALAVRIHKGADSPLLRLFIARWRRAAAAGKLAQSAFPWFDAVDWLVGALHGASPASPGATRTPKSPRIVSPVAVPLRRAQTTAPVPKQPARHLAGSASTPARHAPVRRLPPVAMVMPQPGRQGISLRMLNQLQSPTRLADTPAPQPVVLRTVSGVAALNVPVFSAAEGPADAAPVSQADRLAPTATLLDMLLQEYLASASRETSGSRSTGTQCASSSNGEPSADDSQ